MTMHSPGEDITALDPFNLCELVQDTDRRIFGIITHDYEKVVPEAGLIAVKNRLRDAASALSLELMNDVQDLQKRLGTTEIINGERHLPDLTVMAERIALVYAPPPPNTEELQQWALRRVQWAVDNWLHLSLMLLSRVADGSPVAVDMTTDPGSATSHVRVPRPQELENFGTGWGLISRATGEYLQAKSELLNAHGIAAPQLNITFERGQNAELKDASKALWSNQTYTPHLVTQALRYVLLNAMQINSPQFDLRGLLTSDLVSLAATAGLPLAFSAEVLGGLVVSLEQLDARCEAPSVGFLFPAARILLSAAETISALPPQPTVVSRAMELLLRSAQGSTASTMSS